jgi:hypothetical protein
VSRHDYTHDLTLRPNRADGYDLVRASGTLGTAWTKRPQDDWLMR